MKTKWKASEEEILAACGKVRAQQDSDGLVFVDRDAMIAALQPARKLRDDCLVVFDYENCGATWGYCRADRIPEHGVVNVRPLITVDEAREIARRAVNLYAQVGDLVTPMGGIDRDLDAYQFGPTDA